MYTSVNSVFVVRAQQCCLFKRDETLISQRKLAKAHCKYERMYFRVSEGAPQQWHKEQVPILCHCNTARRQSSRTNFTPCHDFCLCRSRSFDFVCLPQWKAANVALYVNATLFVRVLHMSITPCSNPTLRLGSGTSPPACVHGLAARVAVTAYNLQQACSLATCCFECVCIEIIITVPDTPALHTQAFITFNNGRLVFEWHIACRAR